MSVKIKKYLESSIVVKIIFFILVCPFMLVFLNLVLETIFNLGTYFGTFLRYLFEFIAY